MSNSCELCQKQSTQTCSACGRAFYCCRQHQKDDWKRHREACVCFKIERNETLGRYVRATRNIRAGEIIMKCPPLLLGPKTLSPPLCLGCHKRLNLERKRYDCKRCHWPVCDEKCEASISHSLECEVFAKSNYKPPVRNDCLKQSVYSPITPLRALLLKKYQPDKFDYLMESQSHLDKHLTNSLYQILKRSLVPFLIDVLNIDTNETEILTICSIFDTNCFEVRDPQGFVNIRGVYPSIALLSHECKPNTKHSFQGDGFEIILTATVPIKKGDLITTTYTQTLWGNLERRTRLRISKNFDCECPRCRDPTELGTCLGSLNCIQCLEGMVLSSDPLDYDADWLCQKCGSVMVADEFRWRNEALKGQISELDKSDPDNLEDFLRRHQGTLHERNSFCLQVKYALSQMYGNMDGFHLDHLAVRSNIVSNSELSDELLDRKIRLCEELLEVADILEPGHSRFRGSLLYDLHMAMMEKAKRSDKSLAQEAVKHLREAEEILRIEPDLRVLVEKRMKELSL